MISSIVELVGKHDLAQEIHGWAQDLLRTDDRCGVGQLESGRYVVIWSGRIDHWIHCSEDDGCSYLGTLNRDSTVADVENLLEGT